jgi:hypothetical protein
LRVLAAARASEKYRFTGIARTVLQTPNAALIAGLLAGSIRHRTKPIIWHRDTDSPDHLDCDNDKHNRWP